MQYQEVNLYFADESRFGLFTRNGKALTAKGIKPICPFHQIFKTTYLFGAFSPINGDKFLLELPFCNADTFQIFLDEFSVHTSGQFNIVVLDNGAFHKAASLIIPKNIGLVFLPPYSPELNPAEKVWASLKRMFSNKLFHSLDQISDFIAQSLKSIHPENIKSICAYSYIFQDNIWTI